MSLIVTQLVLATDLEDILDSNTKNNLILNNLQNKENIKLIPLEWNNSEHINHIINNYPKIDYILLSECLYEEAPFDKLLLTLIKFAKLLSQTLSFAPKISLKKINLAPLLAQISISFPKLEISPIVPIPLFCIILICFKIKLLVAFFESEFREFTILPTHFIKSP